MKKLFKKLGSMALKKAALVAIIYMLEYALTELKAYSDNPKAYEKDELENMDSDLSDQKHTVQTV